MVVLELGTMGASAIPDCTWAWAINKTTNPFSTKQFYQRELQFLQRFIGGAFCRRCARAQFAIIE